MSAKLGPTVLYGFIIPYCGYTSISRSHRQFTAVLTPMVNIYPLMQSQDHLRTLEYPSSSYVVPKKTGALNHNLY